MATIQPKGENVRRAVKWISEMLKEEESRAMEPLIEKASRQFNLSPKEEDFLRSFYKEEGVKDL